MLGLILIYFIGRQFYDLANDFQRNRWLFAVLGVVSFYLGTFVAGLIIGVLSNYYEFFSDLLTQNQLVLGFASLPIGLLFCWGLHQLLKNNWKKRKEDSFGDFEIIDNESAES